VGRIVSVTTTGWFRVTTTTRGGVVLDVLCGRSHHYLRTVSNLSNKKFDAFQFPYKDSRNVSSDEFRTLTVAILVAASPRQSACDSAQCGQKFEKRAELEFVYGSSFPRPTCIQLPPIFITNPFLPDPKFFG
jgi:hypothetical protein